MALLPQGKAIFAMKISPLKSGQKLGCAAYEILSVPDYASLAETEEKAQQQNESAFCQLLTECSRCCAPGSTALELLWSAQEVENRPYRCQLHLYFIIRMIARTEVELNLRIARVRNNVLSHLQAEFFRTAERDVDALCGLLPGAGACVSGIVKSDQCTVHAQGLMPYYYVQPLQADAPQDFAMLSRTMADLPGSAVSFQLIPDAVQPPEAATITNMFSILNQISGGSMMMMGGGIPYQDSMAQAARDAYAYRYSNLRQPHFRYNILAFGNPNQCSALSAQLISILKGSGNNSFTAVNLNRERLSMREQLVSYPWNLNKHLMMNYRNAYFLQTMQVPQTVVRLPYLITAEEAGVFFRLPLSNNRVVGIQSHYVVQSVQQLSNQVVNPENINIGTLVGADQHSAEIFCPPKTFTMHAFVTGKPGTGKTTFAVYLLLQMYRKGIPFLAIEPTKTEYRAMIDAIPELQIFTPGSNGVSPFVINPFIPPRGITVEQFVPSLASAFKAAFSMPSPLDAIFQSVIHEVYVKYGWKDYSTAQDPDVTLFGLHEFILVFKQLIADERYSSEVKGNLQSGGVLRLRNLIEQNANIYDTTQSVPLEDLLSKPTVLELNAIDNEEQKSVLMALLFINICVYTKHNQLGDGQLKNMLLIDEAHVLFKAQGGKTEDSAKGTDTTVRSLENMIAEIRAYGTSIVIADQSPAAVGSEVIKNTDIKMVFQLVEDKDRQAIASTTSMSDAAKRYIPKLGVGQAFVSFLQLEEPVLVQTPDIRAQANIRLSVSNDEVRRRMTYWDSHGRYLIPFEECKYSAPCKECSLRLRSDAAFYATRFIQAYGRKIVNTSTMLGYLKAMDTWLDQHAKCGAEQRVTLHNCAKIRFLRQIMQKKDITLSSAEYAKVLKAFLNQP